MVDDDLTKISKGDGEKNPEDSSKEIEALENKIQDLEKQNNELKFYWLISIIITLDAFVLSNHQSWGGPLAVCTLEIILIIGMSKKLQIEYMAILTDKIFHLFEANKNTK